MIILSLLVSLLTMMLTVVLTLFYILTVVVGIAIAVAVMMGIYLLIYLIADAKFKKLPKEQYSVKNIAVHMILSAVTLGYYSAYRQALLIKNVRRLSGKDESCKFEFICYMLVPFYYVYWWIVNSNTVSEKLASKGISSVSNRWANTLLTLTFGHTLPQVLMQHDFNNLEGKSELN